MAYTGVNRFLSQDIGFASSSDLFQWDRWESNPLSPAKNRKWSFWRSDGIASCRDPHMLHYEGRIWMTYTTNTKQGATCIALISTKDFSDWKDHGPILVGSKDGYEPRLSGGHPQGQLESSCLLRKNKKWYLFVQNKRRNNAIRNWVFESDKIDCFDYTNGREFWPGAYTVEIVKERGAKSLLACTGPIRFGEVDWSHKAPAGKFLKKREELSAWQF